jgi:pilus assembly protein FimV
LKYSIIKRIPLAIMFALVSLAVQAAGLGRLSVASGLGEPLSADIEVFGAPGELGSMAGRVAPLEDYVALGLDRPVALDNVKVSVDKKPDGTTVLHLASTRPIDDPFVELVVQVEWQGGKLSREYNALLDPPGFGERTEAAKALPVVPDNKGGNAATPKNPSVTEGRVAGAAPAAAPSLAPDGPATRQAYLTKRGDTLRQIAWKVKVDEVSVEQMIVSLYRENPGAFAKGNLNRLKVGQNLTVPSVETVEAISQEDAVREIKVQTTNWSAYRTRLASMAKRSGERSGAAIHQARAHAAAEDVQRMPTDRYVLKVSPGDIEYTLGAHDGTKSGPEKLAPARP